MRGVRRPRLATQGALRQTQPLLVLPQGVCEELLNGPLFSGCTELVNVSSYVEACKQDLCLCASKDLQPCLCQTLAEYSRQCAHAGGLPQDWRGPDLCRECPHPAFTLPGCATLPGVP